jgi:hypothetical protein
MHQRPATFRRHDQRLGFCSAFLIFMMKVAGILQGHKLATAGQLWRALAGAVQHTTLLFGNFSM